MNNKNDILKKTTAMNLYLRIMVGGFLVYLAYTLAIDLGNTSGNDTIIFGVAAGIFALAGAGVVIWSVYRLIKKDYYDPMTEPEPEEQEATTDETE